MKILQNNIVLGLHISTNINRLGAVLGSFWAVWRGLLLSLEPKHQSWQFLRYWWFNKWYHGGYLLICLISWPILIASRCDWHGSKRSFQELAVAIETVRIIKELMKIWPNEVCDTIRLSWLMQHSLPVAAKLIAFEDNPDVCLIQAVALTAAFMGIYLKQTARSSNSR